MPTIRAGKNAENGNFNAYGRLNCTKSGQCLVPLWHSGAALRGRDNSLPLTGDDQAAVLAFHLFDATPGPEAHHHIDHLEIMLAEQAK